MVDKKVKPQLTQADAADHLICHWLIVDRVFDKLSRRHLLV